MRKIIAFFSVAIAILVAFGEGSAFSPTETNRVARKLIYRAMRLSGCHTIPDEGVPYNPDEELGTWHGFLEWMKPTNFSRLGSRLCSWTSEMASEVHTVSCVSGSDKVECQGLLGDMGVSDYNENTLGESMTILQRTRKLLTLGLPAGSVSGFCAKF